jgi:hypothetical protein
MNYEDIKVGETYHAKYDTSGEYIVLAKHPHSRTIWYTKPCWEAPVTGNDANYLYWEKSPPEVKAKFLYEWVDSVGGRQLGLSSFLSTEKRAKKYCKRYGHKLIKWPAHPDYVEESK